MKALRLLLPYLPILVGILLGTALGYFGQCSSGTCPLTSTWWRGALYGGVLGLLFTFSSRSPTAASEKEKEATKIADQSGSRQR